MLKKIGFIDHLERNNWWPAKEFFYDLIASSIEVYFKIISSKSLRMSKFEKENISKYIYEFKDNNDWIHTYEQFSEDLEELYESYILNHEICLSYEASPSIIKLLKKSNKIYCDFRIVNCNIYLPFFSKKSACLLKIDLLTSTQVFS